MKKKIHRKKKKIKPPLVFLKIFTNIVFQSLSVPLLL